MNLFNKYAGRGGKWATKKQQLRTRWEGGPRARGGEVKRNRTENAYRKNQLHLKAIMQLTNLLVTKIKLRKCNCN